MASQQGVFGLALIMKEVIETYAGEFNFSNQPLSKRVFQRHNLARQFDATS